MRGVMCSALHIEIRVRRTVGNRSTCVFTHNFGLDEVKISSTTVIHLLPTMELMTGGAQHRDSAKLEKWVFRFGKCEFQKGTSLLEADYKIVQVRAHFDSVQHCLKHLLHTRGLKRSVLGREDKHALGIDAWVLGPLDSGLGKHLLPAHPAVDLSFHSTRIR